jgi:hypothetical protein
VTRPKPRPTPALDEPRVMPTHERGQHDALVYTEVIVFSELGQRGTSKAMATRVTTQRAIDRLWSVGVLDDRQFSAACKFWALYAASGMEPVGAIDYNRAGGGSGGPAFVVADFAYKARQEWRAAQDAIPRGRVRLFEWVVKEDKPLRQWVARHGMRPGRAVYRAGQELREALDAVCRHWGL